MKGYWGSPDATADAIDADGWFHTGDIGHVDDDGDFYIVDRKKDIVIRGGYNVYPREIEEVLYEHPESRGGGGRRPARRRSARRSARPSCSSAGATATADELRDFVRERVAATSTRGSSGSSTSCPRARPARSSSARSRSRQPPMSDLGIVLLGPPGAGKGTQAGPLAADHGLAYLSTGDLLRAAARAGTPAGRSAQRFMNAAGELVPDALLLALLEEAMPAGGSLLDGFPRTLGQAEALGAQVDLAILIDVPR